MDENLSQEEIDRLCREALLQHRMENDPAFKKNKKKITNENEVKNESPDIWRLTEKEERALIEHGTLAWWAQDLLRESLLEDNPQATSDIYKNAGMVLGETGIWDYPDGIPDDSTPHDQQEENEEPEQEEPSEEEILKALREYRNATGRY